VKRFEFIRTNIQSKIIIFFCVITGIVLIGLYFYLNNYLVEYNTSQIQSNLQKELFLIRSYIETKIDEKSTDDELKTIINNLSTKLSVRITIFDLSKKILVDSKLTKTEIHNQKINIYRPEIIQALKNRYGQSRRISKSINEERLFFATLFGKNKPIGIVRVAIPISQLNQISIHLKTIMTFALIFAFVIVFVLSYLASVYLVKPIKAMLLAIESIAKGDFSKKAAVISHDEIGDLAKAFNFMTKQINLRIEEVKQSRSHLEAVLLSMFEGVIVVDATGNTILMNQALKTMLNIKEDLIGKAPFEFIKNIEIQEITNNILNLNKNVETREISLLIPDIKVLLAHATPVITRNKIEGAVLVFHDITELRHLEKIRQEFVANVSHELRTPIANIKGYAETLLDGALQDEKYARDFIKVIYSNSNLLANLINDILDLSRIESGKLTLSLTKFQIKPIIKRVVTSFNQQAKSKAITINLNIPPKLSSVIADETRLTQVLLNLVDNAIKYNKENGEIIISAEETNSSIRISISDNGVGIPENDIPRLFERFYRADKGRSREMGGTGLGLSIVKHIIQAHEGELSINSQEGFGSTFSFTIPKA
jgi:two-component system, OmpR family, phosphate regulon sensor histidine kinase PhoR